MRLKIIIITSLLFICSCGLLSGSPAVSSAAGKMLELVGEKVAAEINKRLEDLNTSCEFEINQKEHKMYSLCVTDLGVKNAK